MFFTFPEDFKVREPFPGIILRLVWGERVMISHVTFQPHSSIPTHSHPQEQTGIVIEGEMELTIGDESRICRKGDAFTVPGNIEHSAGSRDSVTTVIDTFSPPREDYM